MFPGRLVADNTILAICLAQDPGGSTSWCASSQRNTNLLRYGRNLVKTEQESPTNTSTWTS